MKKVAVIGHFGFGHDLANGQTIKTKIVAEEIHRFCNEKPVCVDAHGGIKAIIPVAFGAINSLRKCDNVIMMLTENGLKVCIPILAVFNKIFRRRLHYVVVGGWLPDFLKKHPGLVRELKSFYLIYVETYNMKSSLEQIGIKNVVVMPNCKNIKILDRPEKCSRPYKLCTFSRVMREKGIEDAVLAVKKANQKLGESFYRLDIYGQIDSKQEEWFEELKKTFPEYIKYGGTIQYDRSTDILKDYFLLLFPTYYVGEGFAGTAIDAFSAGVPVLASNWKYNSEVINEGINGGLFEAHNIEQMADRLVNIAQNTDKWEKMRENCLQDAEKYRPDKVLKKLFENLK